MFILNGRYYQMFPTENPGGYQTEEITFDLNRTVFLIIDVYGKGYDENEKCDVDALYSTMFDKWRSIVMNHIVPDKEAAKSIKIPVVYLENYLAPSTTKNNEWRKMSIRTCGVDVLEAWVPPTDLFEYAGKIKPQTDDYVIRKQHYSGFFETHLESLLKELDCKDLIVVGFDSAICLRSTVLDALWRNYRITVIRDAIGTSEFPDTEEGNWANKLAVRFIETNIGYTCTSDEFLIACKNYKKEE
ncbi:MAG: isochorismatase family cysteine hydrolase [Flexilinea sp.]